MTVTFSSTEPFYGFGSEVFAAAAVSSHLRDATSDKKPTQSGGRI